MKWTFDRMQELVVRVRAKASETGCRKCGRIGGSLELEGRPSLTRMLRAGAGIERVREAIRERGWYCRGCARGMKKLEEEKSYRKTEEDRRVREAKEREAEEIRKLEERWGGDRKEWGEEKKFAFIHALDELEWDHGTLGMVERIAEVSRDEEERKMWWDKMGLEEQWVAKQIALREKRNG